MSNKWLEREGAAWVEKGIITHQQYEEIVKLYPQSQKKFSQLLPIFASLLVALSLLTFVASNWDGIPQWGRIAILFLTLISFYLSGFSLYRNGQVWIGQGLLVVGVFSFGASMILIGQMFQLIAYDARLFVFWSLAALSLWFLYHEQVFYFLTAGLLSAGQVYAVLTFDHSSWLLFAVTVIGLGYPTYLAKSPIFGWILAPLIGLQSILLLTVEQDAWSWIFIIPISLYACGLWLGERPVAKGFLVWPVIFGLFFSTLMVFVHHHVYQDALFLAKPASFLIIFILLLAAALWKTQGQTAKRWPFILFLPLFYFSFAEIAYLVVMFVYASILIYTGDQENNPRKSNIGIGLFMFSTLIGYVQLAWDVFDKSLFFLIGGIVLFAIHWILRKRSRWLRKGEDRPW